KASKILPHCCGEMPMPVSETTNWRVQPSESRRRGRRETQTSPCSVNLSALRHRAPSGEYRQRTPSRCRCACLGEPPRAIEGLPEGSAAEKSRYSRDEVSRIQPWKDRG